MQDDSSPLSGWHPPCMHVLARRNTCTKLQRLPTTGHGIEFTNKVLNCYFTAESPTVSCVNTVTTKQLHMCDPVLDPAWTYLRGLRACWPHNTGVMTSIRGLQSAEVAQSSKVVQARNDHMRN